MKENYVFGNEAFPDALPFMQQNNTQTSNKTTHQLFIHFSNAESGFDSNRIPALYITLFINTGLDTTQHPIYRVTLFDQ